jgi:hypothetical protein
MSNMLKQFTVLCTALFLLSALAGAQSIPAGTPVKVILNQSISSEKANTGDSFNGVLAADLVVNNNTIAQKGDAVKGTVTYANPSGRLSKPGQLTLRLTSIKNINVMSSFVSRKGASHTKSNATKIGGGAAAGALIGGLVGGGKGAAIGAGAGAGAGTGVAAATGKKDVTISAESTLSFTVQSK